MIGKAKAISYGINAIRYIKGESQHKKHPELITTSVTGICHPAWMRWEYGLT